MRYFNRTNRLSNILLVSSAILLVISLFVLGGGVLDQVFEFSNGNYVRGGIIFTIWFLLSLIALITGIALKCIVKDAKEELDIIKKIYDEKLK
jgi:hypothetical protein